MSVTSAKHASTSPYVIAPQAGNPSPFTGLLLTDNSRAPVGKILSFYSANAVKEYFGLSALESSLAEIYFKGSQKSDIFPSKMYITQMPQAAVGAYLRGGKITDLAAVKAITAGVITVTIDGGAPITTAAMDFSVATSFSAAAAILSSALVATVSYDSTAQAFVITSSTTGENSSVSFATGASSAALKLDSANAVQSLGSAAAVPDAFMTAISNQVRDWTNFATTFLPDDADKLAFSQWTAGKETYCYVCWDSNAQTLNPLSTTDYATKINGISANAFDTAGNLIYTVQPTYVLDNTYMLYGTDATIAVFFMGAAAAVDINSKNAWDNLTYIYQANLVPTITSDADFDLCRSKRVNFYELNTDNNNPKFLFDSSISGKYRRYTNFLAMRLVCYKIQESWLELMTSVKNLPFTDSSKAIITQHARDSVMSPMVALGAIVGGVTFDRTEILQVRSTSQSPAIASELAQRGYFVEVVDFTVNDRMTGQCQPRYWFTTGGNILTSYSPVYEVL